MKGLRVGYIRVSSKDQNIDRQLEGITLDKTFVDRLSGKNMDRDQFKIMMDFLREGDSLIVHSLDRLSRNLIDLRKIVDTLVKKKIRVESLKENLIFTGDDSPMSILTLSMLGAFAEFDRSMIRERQREGIELARQKGVFRGRKMTFNKEQVAEVLNQVLSGKPISQIGREFNVTRQTIYQYMRRNGVSVESLNKNEKIIKLNYQTV